MMTYDTHDILYDTVHTVHAKYIYITQQLLYLQFTIFTMSPGGTYGGTVFFFFLFLLLSTYGMITTIILYDSTTVFYDMYYYYNTQYTIYSIFYHVFSRLRSNKSSLKL